MKQFEVKALGIQEMKSDEIMVTNGGNVCGTLVPQDSDPSIVVDAIIRIAKDIVDFCEGFWDGFTGKQ